MYIPIYPSCAYYDDVFFGTPLPQKRLMYENVIIIRIFRILKIDENRHHNSF